MVGSLVNMFAYLTFEPVLVGCLFLFSTLVLLHFFSAADKYERQAFVLVFSICWFWAGVSAVYANYFNDVGQNDLDAAYFFEIVTQGKASTSGVMEVLLLIENGGAMLLWRFIYDFFYFLGFEKARYIGITVNVSLVALTCVVGIKIVKIIFGNDLLRIRRFMLLFACCCLFWMFASIHLRDALTLIAVSLLALYWVDYLTITSLKKLLKLFAATIIGFLLFGLLRREFIFVPAAMICAGMAAFIFTKQSGSRRIKVIVASLLVGAPISAYLLLATQLDFMVMLETGKETYSSLAEREGSGVSSLGNDIIVNQPLPLRLLLGSVYLFVFPIPFWAGFQLDTAYHLFKSMHVLYMYVLTPLFGLSLWRVMSVSSFRTTPILFLLFVVLGFMLSIAYTSLENRHFVSFFIPLLVLSVLPNLSQGADRRNYRALFLLFIALICIVHFLWLVLKLSL
jgi:hypothetical protein